MYELLFTKISRTFTFIKFFECTQKYDFYRRFKTIQCFIFEYFELRNKPKNFDLSS